MTGSHTNWKMRTGGGGARAQSVYSEQEYNQPGNSEDLHAWSIYRQVCRTALASLLTSCILLCQNLNSDFTDSALGSTDKSALPFGDFRMRESTMQSILNNPKYGPRSELGEWKVPIMTSQAW